MGIETIIGAIGVAASVAGTVVSVVGAQGQANAAARAEQLRKQQMQLDADRQRRELYRQSIIQRANALNTATASGSQFGSGLGGAYGQIAGQAGRQIVNVNQNEQIGKQIFDANASGSAAASMSYFGSGLSSLGNGMVNNMGTIARVIQSF